MNDAAKERRGVTRLLVSILGSVNYIWPIDEGNDRENWMLGYERQQGTKCSKMIT